MPWGSFEQAARRYERWYTTPRGQRVDVAERALLDYGDAFGMSLRFRTTGGDAPVLRLLWRKEADVWRITSYVVELP